MNQHGQFSETQKAGFALLLIFGLVTVGMGFLQLRNTIYSPFVIRAGGSSLAQNIEDETVKQQRSDTDRDGISDYDELNFYQTSPYLPDTDSDGIPDKKEIDAGADPLCPEGQQCSSSALATAASSSAPAGETRVGADTGAAGGNIDALVGNPAALRDLLKKTGKFTDEQLAKIDDATLLKFATEVAAGTQ